MIRKLHAEDLDQVVTIWYSASILAHDFISEAFWLSQKQPMQEIYLPNSDTWVYEVDGNILGFISHYQGFVPALFITPNAQSQGLGHQLLNSLKQQHNELQLTVYAENSRAHQFYQKQGFKEVERKPCEHTAHEEIVMIWHSAS